MKRLVVVFIAVMSMSFYFLSVQADTKDTVISFDIDDVISSKQKIGIRDYIGLARAVFLNPRVLTLFLPDIRTRSFKKFAEIRREADEIARTTDGTANVVHKMLGKLKEQGYGDLSAYEDEIVFRSINPKPIPEMIKNVEKLKQQGCKVVAATNQDYKQHQAYRAKMKKNHNLDLNELFDAVLTTNVMHEQPDKKEPFFKVNTTDNIYAVSDGSSKTDTKYFAAEKMQIKAIIPQHDKIIHVDDKKENIESAKKEGFETIHFDLDDQSARKAGPKKVGKAVDVFKKDLSSLGVTL